MLIVISGPSGSGKGTIIKEVIKKISDLIYSVSYTTRPKREGEIEGKDYFFISEDEFEKLIDEDFFIEWAKVYDYYYGTSKEFVIENLRDGKDVILEIEIQGAKKIREIYDKKNAVFIFIAPPDFKELERRIMNRKRGETEEEIKKRMDFAKKEIEESKNYDYIIINDNINKAVKKIINIINKERRKIYDSRF
ncbi:MAG TPA: guanylate kinase [Caldisericia bacterium]|nr:guanylate kinase [Caldisericia bacterium]HOL82506.1 guanylate kinase [Caldisericia bacterium]HPC56748.1 guanylate kinase [Caldisericia bacterium]HPP43835.1 guanylate kinase [Caldisericia bacterium]HRT36870.1 guanylate kinase [Caldisericia bacterium]